MKRRWMILLAVVLVATACGGDSSGESGGDGDTSNVGSDSGTTSDNGESGFGAGDLPDGFPSDLIPPSFSSGQITDIAGQQVVAFRSEQSFDDALDHYTGLLGDPQLIEAGDSRQAQWLDGPEWAVALFVSGDDPLQISMTKIAE